MVEPTSLREICGRAVEAALAAGAGDAEAFAEDSRTVEVRVFEGEPESVTDAGSRGVGLRVWCEGRAGHAFGTDLSEAGVGEIAAAAVEAARVCDPDEHAAAPDPADASGGVPAVEGLAAGSVAAWGNDRKVELAVSVDRAAAGVTGVTGVEQTVYADERSSVAIASSRGVAGAWEATSAWSYAQALAGAGADRESGLGLGVARGPDGLDAGAIGGEAGRRAAALLGAGTPASRTCAVVLDPFVAASFAGFIGGAICADAVQRGRSPFAGKLREQVASEVFALHDDGLAPDGLASSPLDGEGVPRRRTALVEGRSLRAFLHDSYTARREGTASTGSAARGGYRSQPAVATSNLIVGVGQASLERLIADVGQGVLITDVAGLHSGVNPVTGQFSVGASGVEISGGELGKPASGFTIASDLITMLGAVTATGSDARWVPFGGSVKTPAIAVGEMAIGGS